MDKFVLNIQPRSDGFKLLNIRRDTHDLLKEMKEQTGVSMGSIVHEAIKFCFERLEIEDE